MVQARLAQLPRSDGHHAIGVVVGGELMVAMSQKREGDSVASPDPLNVEASPAAGRLATGEDQEELISRQAIRRSIGSPQQGLAAS